jgi:hypothetical protein
MEEAPENDKESSHSAHTNEMNEYFYTAPHYGLPRVLLYKRHAACVITTAELSC